MLWGDIDLKFASYITDFYLYIYLNSWIHRNNLKVVYIRCVFLKRYIKNPNIVWDCDFNVKPGISKASCWHDYRGKDNTDISFKNAFRLAWQV
jgi:hypothetical protein